MREFPRVAVMERRMLTAENEMNFCFNSPTRTGEHDNISDVCVYVPLPVIFVVAIILLSFPLFLQVILNYSEEYFVLTAPFKSR